MRQLLASCAWLTSLYPVDVDFVLLFTFLKILAKQTSFAFTGLLRVGKQLAL